MAFFSSFGVQAKHILGAFQVGSYQTSMEECPENGCELLSGPDERALSWLKCLSLAGSHDAETRSCVFQAPRSGTKLSVTGSLANTYLGR